MRASSPASFLLAAALLTAGAARAAEGGAGRIVNLKDMSCAQYAALPEADRAPVVWYMAGYYRAGGIQAKRFDLDRASTALPKVLETCQARPEASLRYTVRDVLRPAAAPKKAGKGEPPASARAADAPAR